ncbi:MAG: hypothetical protein U0520_00045 [Candidatus Saccharimonadales bacterium]
MKDWAQQELEAANTTLQVWDQYHQNLGEGTPVPTTLDQLLESSPNLASTLEYSTKPKQIFKIAVRPTLTVKISPSLKLMVMPWQDIKDAFLNLTSGSLADARNKALPHKPTTLTMISWQLIKNGTPLYRLPAAPGTLISAEHYLSLRIAEDGPWGVALVQTSKVAGVNSKLGQSPNQLTADGSAHLQIADHSIDGLGIFEWIATTLQADPRQFSPVDVSWMLANRLEGGPFVPLGDWGVGRVRSGLYGASVARSVWRPSPRSDERSYYSVIGSSFWFYLFLCFSPQGSKIFSINVEVISPLNLVRIVVAAALILARLIPRRIRTTRTSIT